MKIFFFGGTFDPPHIGHKMIVDKCYDKCDKFIIFPNLKSPHKIDFGVKLINHIQLRSERKVATFKPICLEVSYLS